MTEHFDPYHKWLAIPPEDQPPNHYRLLALPLFESDPDVISAAAEQRMAHVRTYQLGKQSELSQKLLNEIAAARVCLLTPEKKTVYDQKLKRQMAAAATPAKPLPVAKPIQSHPSKPAPFPSVEPSSPANHHTTPLGRKQQPWLIPLAIAAAAVVVIGLLAIVLSGGGNKEVAKSKGDGKSGSRATAKKTPGALPGGHPKTDPAVDIKPKVQPPIVVETPPVVEDKPKVQTPEQPETSAVVEKPSVVEKPTVVENSPKPPGDGDPPKPTKLPVPSEADQAKALTLVHEAYKDDYEGAKTPDQKVALARKLLGDVGKNKNDFSSHFVLLTQARAMATEALDGQSAFDAIAELDAAFQIDALEMKATVLSEFAQSARTADQHKSLAEKAAEVANEAVAEENFPVAEQLGDLALYEVRKARDGTLIKQTLDHKAQIETTAKAYEAAKEAKVILETRPDDPQANLTVGKYLCLVQGDWETGLPMLELGSDPVLKALAVKDLQGASTPDAQVLLGHGWWDLAEKESGTERSSLLARAYAWYDKAAPKLDGLQRQLAETRCDSIRNEVPDLKRRLAAQGDAGAGSPVAHANSDAAAEAIGLGLKWVVAKQEADGHWTFAAGPNGGNLTSCTETATAMALIPLLRAGHTHRMGAYQENVGKGLRYLAGRMKADKNGGSFHREGSSMYGQGICAIALGEAYARSKDRALRVPAQAAVNYIVYAQDPKGGGWRYKPRQPGDTSVLGWQLQALKAAQAGGLTVPKQTMQMAWKFLDSVQANNGATYGYIKPGEGHATTAIGLWSRLTMGAKPNDVTIRKGIDFCVANGPSGTNYYCNYYVSCLLKSCGPESAGKWTTQMRRQILASQSKDGEIAGSWFSGGDHGCEQGGRLYCTTMTLMTLLNLGNASE